MRLTPVAVLLLAACVRASHANREENLSGYKGQLVGRPSVGLVVAGSVGERAAEVALDIASPLSTVTAGCFGSSPPSNGFVRVPVFRGGFEELPEVMLVEAHIGAVRLAPRRVGFVRQIDQCVLVLGSDVLGLYRIDFDPARRMVTLERSATRSAYIHSPVGTAEEQIVPIEMTKDPRADWPLLAVSLVQDDEQLIEPFIVSTREEQTCLSREIADAAKLRAIEGAEKSTSYALDELSLAPGFELRGMTVCADNQWKNQGAAGILGGDVWGRFNATFDLQAGRLVLRRPALKQISLPPPVDNDTEPAD